MCGGAVGPDNGPGAGGTAFERMAARAADARNGGPQDSRCPEGAGEEGGGNAAARKIFSKIVLASPSEFPYSTFSHGGVAQLGERLTGSQEVRGSIPLVSTIVNSKGRRVSDGLFSYPSTAQTKVTRVPAFTPQKVAQLPSRFCTKFVSQA